MKFWLDEPTILFNSKYILDIYPYDNMDNNEKLNAVTRFIILITLFGYMCLNNYLIFILGLIMIGIVIFLHRTQNEKVKEGYTNISEQQIIESNNPLRNILMDDYKYNVNKKTVDPEYTPEVEESINNATKKFILQENKDNNEISTIFSSLGDTLSFEQSMRQFYTTPNTSIPNNSGDFLKYLYGDLPSEKPLKIY
jgi:hypothetical protein